MHGLLPPTSEANNCRIKVGWPFVGLKICECVVMNNWRWNNKNGPFSGVVQVKAKCHDFILEKWTSIISEFAWVTWISPLNHYWDAITLIHPTASMPSVFLCRFSSTLRPVQFLGMDGKVFLPGNPLFSLVDCRRKFCFFVSWVTLSLYCSRGGTAEDCFVSVPVGTREGSDVRQDH